MARTVSTSQVDNGKAFEYAVAQALAKELALPITEGPEYLNTKNSFEKVTSQLQERFPKAATLAVHHI